MRYEQSTDTDHNRDMEEMRIDWRTVKRWGAFGKGSDYSANSNLI